MQIPKRVFSIGGVRVPFDSLSRTDRESISQNFRLMTIQERQARLEKVLFQASSTNVCLPRVFGLLDTGELTVKHEQCELLSFPEGCQHPLSNLIRTEQTVFSQDLMSSNRYLRLSHQINLDADLFSVQDNSLCLRRFDNFLEFDRAFSLLGVHCDHWGHFLLEFLPKLLLCREFIDGHTWVLCPETADDHMRGIVSRALGDHSLIAYIPTDSPVKCHDLLFCTHPSYLCQHAKYSSCLDIVVPTETRRTLRGFLTTLTGYSRSPTKPERLFIEYEGPRNIRNYSEINHFFSLRGYQSVTPHKLSLDEKIAVFSGAKYVVGPQSSGFTNLLFSKQDVSAIALSNYHRSFDSYLSQFKGVGSNINIYNWVSNSQGTDDLNSGFTVDLVELEKYMQIEHGGLSDFL